MCMYITCHKLYSYLFINDDCDTDTLVIHIGVVGSSTIFGMVTLKRGKGCIISTKWVVQQSPCAPLDTIVYGNS